MTMTRTSVPHARLFGSEAFGKLIHEAPMTCLDVGARGGITDELRPLAPGVAAVGFEPDPEECARLNQSPAGPWRSVRYVPTALGKGKGTRTLNLYAQPGCSSLLEADREYAARFARASYYEPVGSAQVDTLGLDAAAKAYGFTDARYLKIDIQGAELEVFRSGPRILQDSMVVIRCEVSFLPMYRDQPLIEDVIKHLRGKDLVPIRFIEAHHWRRTTRTKHPHVAPGPLPYSHGELVHGDLLFARPPHTLPETNDDEIERRVHLAALSLAYEQIDLAHATLTSEPTTAWLRARLGPDFDVERELRRVSRHQASRRSRTRLTTAARSLPARMRNRLVGPQRP